MDEWREAMSVIELVEWLEDVAAGRAGSRLLTLASSDPHARLTTIRAFYQALAEHPGFGPVWPASLPVGSVAAAHPAPARSVGTPRFGWLGLCATDEPAAEPLQLADQLDALAAHPDGPAWVREAAAGPFRSSLVTPLAESPGDVADQAFAALGEPVGGIVTKLGAATRSLESVLSGRPLLADGGALGLDAPGARARALVAAGWLQRLATHAPMVLVVDEAHRAGAFLLELVDAVLAASTPILVVLSGEPAARTTALPGRGRRQFQETAALDDPELAGAFRTFAGQPIEVHALPAGTVGTTIALLAAALPSGLFTLRHVAAALRANGDADDDDADAALAGMHEWGWIRMIGAGVYDFVSVARRQLAARHARRTLSDQALLAGAGAIRAVAAMRPGTGADDLANLVEWGAAAEDRDDPDAAWRFARLLASNGEMARSARIVAPFVRDPLERAIARAWAGDDDHPGPITAAHSPEALVAEAATLARRHPEEARTRLARAMHDLTAAEGDATLTLRLRLAAARTFLSLGDLAGAHLALDAGSVAVLSADAAERLISLAPWRAHPGLVARTIETLAGLQLIETLRATMPGSAALAMALIGRLELLDRLGRLDTTGDGLAIAWEAGHLLASGSQRQPAATWRAIGWLSWATQRRGDTPTALRLLDQLAAEQETILPAQHPALHATRVWRARCLLDAGQLAVALDEIDRVLHEQLRVLEDDDPVLVSTHHWHAEIVARLGDHRAAADELTDVVARRGRAVAADDEDLLASRHRLGSALANTQRPTEALRQFSEVIARRSACDVEDAPRLLAARHSRAVCLLVTGRADEARRELDQVLAHRAVALEPNDPLLIDARSDRAACLVAVQQYQRALDDLDEVLAQRLSALRPGDERVVQSRQQRVICLLHLHRTAEALAEIDGILTAAHGTLPLDDPMLSELRVVRAQLQHA